ncbi:MAG: transposase [Micromonosporaceae bacterium]
MSRSRKPSLSLEERAQIVLAVLRGAASVAEAARRHGVTATTVAKWRDRFIDAGRQGAV